MVSNIVVVDRPSLAANFAENSKNVLCQAAFGAGAYAIGARLVGAASLTPPGALATGAALVAALAFCPASGNPNDILGEPPEFSGGQCSEQYTWTVRWASIGATGPPNENVAFVFGPLDVKRIEERVNSFGTPFFWRVYQTRGLPLQEFNMGFSSLTAEILSETFERSNGLPDNCGNLPRVGGQIVAGGQGGDTITNVEDNRNFSTVIPVQFSIGGETSTVNLLFGPITIGSLFPLDFSINIGDTDFRFKEKPDGELEPAPTSPDSNSPDDKIQDLLRQIRDCACKPQLDISDIFLPALSDDGSCDIKGESISLVSGSLSPEAFGRFAASANLAKSACENLSPPQLPDSLIFSATSTGGELFSPNFGPEVVSLRLKITALSDAAPELITSFPEAGQRKFGSVAYTISSSAGGGDYIYIFDEDTYIPLPRRSKPGQLRALLKDGVSFSVFDTGERL